METLEEDLQNLNLDEEKEKKKKKKKLEERSNLWAENGAALQYPLRPGEPDCAFYMKNGCCGYGSKCRFNHPPMCWWWNQVNWWVPLQSLQGVEEKENKNRPERVQVQQTQCKFYLMPEGCKYGKSCKYSHSAEKPEVEQVELNILGLPFRPGERECPYYLRTGCCKFSANCWFHHPEPVALVAVDHSSVYKIGIHTHRHASGGVSPPHKTSSHLEPLCTLDASPSPFVPKMLLPHQMVQKDSECGEFQAPTSLSSQRRGNVQRSSPSTFTAPAAKVDKPINPHRNPLLMKPPSCMLSPLGLPIRQDKPICTHYEQYGICKYGPSCKFNHPIPSTMKSSMEFSSSKDAKTQEAKLNPLFEQSV